MTRFIEARGPREMLAAVVFLASAMIAAGAQAADAPPPMTVPGAFAVNAQGAATYSIPITVPPGTSGMIPHLSLGYVSGRGDGIVGVGWQLDGLPSITRCPRTVQLDGVHGGVNYDNNDRFCLNGQRLMVINGGTYGADGSEYRTEIESFTRVIAHGSAGNGPAWFEVHDRSGMYMEFGNTTDSRILAVGTSTARAWALDMMRDTKGNYYTVSYTNDTTNGQFYPNRMDYTGNANVSLSTYNSVQFIYNTSRPDVTPMYQAGSVIQTTVLLTDVKTFQGSNLVTDYKLAYRLGSATTRSRLTSVTLCDSSGTNCFAPTTFGWQGGTGQLTMTGTSHSLAQGKPVIPGDFNGDGLTDAAIGSSSPIPVYLGTSGWLNTTAWSSIGCGSGCSLPPTRELLDVQPDGFADVLAAAGGQGFSYAYLNLGSSTGMSFMSLDTGADFQGAWAVGDFNGDGRSDNISQASTTYAWLGDGTGKFNTDGGHSGMGSGTLYVADFDGDGCTDVLDANTTSKITFFCNPAVSSITTPTLSGYTVTLGDFNGDGKTDILLTSKTAAGKLYLSTGTGFVLANCSIPAGWGKFAIYTADIDGNGKTDLILVAPGGQGMYGVGTAHQLWVSTGSCFTQAVDTNNNPITIANGNSQDSSVAAAVADWNNDGAGDFWLKKPSGDVVYTFAYTPELMTSISNGIGASTTIAYDRLNKNGTLYTKGIGGTYPNVQLDGPFYVVSQVSQSNGIGGNYNQTYAYSGAFGVMASYQFEGSASAPLRGYDGIVVPGTLMGFTQIAMSDPQTNLVTTTNYRTDYPFIGRVASQTVTHGSVTVASVSNTWQSIFLNNFANTFVELQQSVASGSDLDGSAVPTVTTTTTTDCDSNPSPCYGNATQIVAQTTYNSATSTKTTTNTFNNDSTNWFLGELLTSNTESVVGSSDLTRHLSFGYDSGSGLLTQESVEPNDCEHNVVTSYTLDGYGHRQSTQVSGAGCSSDNYKTAIATRTSSVGYDALGEFATSTTNALNQSDSWGYSAAFGVATSHTDLNNLTTSWTIDTLGRETLETRPDGTKTAVSYAYCSGVNGGSASCPANGAYLKQSEAETPAGAQLGPIATVYYDALGRVVASDTQGFDASTIRKATQYDANLRVSQTSRPYFVSGGTPKWTTFAYDDLGRAVQATMPDASKTTAAYHGLSVSVTNDKSQTTTTARNAQNLVATVTDALSHATSYSYDAFGDAVSVTDPSGNAVTNTFDIRGNKIASSDPDMGSWSYVYDVLDELIGQTDAKSQTATLAYDVMGRPTGRTEADLFSAWTYGNSAASHNVGKIVQAEACTASGCSTVVSNKTFAYDSLGRPASTTIATGGTNYSYSDTYDANGRLATTTFPSGFVRNNVYTSLSYLCSITDNAGSPTCISAGGSNVFWTANSADAEMHLTGATAGNGVVTTNTFDANTGRLTNVRAGSNNSVAAFDYTWDTIGNLSERADGYQGTFEFFCYDALNRLTNSAIGNTAASCTSSGTGITTKTIGYDALGDITSRSDVGTYSYPAAGQAQPHAVASIAGTVNGAANPSYSYDADGNLTCEYTGASCSGSPVRTISVTSFNMAATVTQGTTTDSFAYDDQHQRISQTLTVSGGTTATVYLNDPLTGSMSEAVVSGATTQWHDYLMSGRSIAAERFCTGAAPCTSGASVVYFNGDHLGSTSALTDQTGAVVERDSYDAWGKRRNADGTDDPTCSLTSATTRGFTAQEHIDSLCAINFNARIYDPVIGRFMSADAQVPNALNGQSFNRYSYVENRPLSWIDPTGHGCGDNGFGAGPCGNQCNSLCQAQIAGEQEIQWAMQGLGVENHIPNGGPNNLGPDSVEGMDFTPFGDPFASVGSDIGQLGLGAASPTGLLGLDNPSFAANPAGRWVLLTQINSEPYFVGGIETHDATAWEFWQPAGADLFDSWYEPVNNVVGGFGVGASAAQYGAGAAALGSNLRLYSGGWGGNQYVSTFKVAKAAAKLGAGLTFASAGLDVVAYQQGQLSSEHLAANLTMDLVGLAGPVGAAYAAAYWALEGFYPGGAEGAVNDYSTTAYQVQQLTGQSFLAPGKISFHPDSRAPTLPARKGPIMRDGVADPYNLPAHRPKI